jgi:hypothetical protein
MSQLVALTNMTSGQAGLVHWVHSTMQLSLHVEMLQMTLCISILDANKPKAYLAACPCIKATKTFQRNSGLSKKNALSGKNR